MLRSQHRPALRVRLRSLPVPGVSPSVSPLPVPGVSGVSPLPVPGVSPLPPVLRADSPVPGSTPPVQTRTHMYMYAHTHTAPLTAPQPPDACQGCVSPLRSPLLSPPRAARSETRPEPEKPRGSRSAKGRRLREGARRLRALQPGPAPQWGGGAGDGGRQRIVPLLRETAAGTATPRDGHGDTRWFLHPLPGWQDTGGPGPLQG